MKTVQKEEIQRVIAKREVNSYKGDFGRLLLIGGTYPYGGAIIMAVRGWLLSQQILII